MKRFRSIICSAIVSAAIVFSPTVFASESKVPVDSKIVGEWVFSFGGDYTRVSIYQNNGVDYLYQLFPDGSGSPVKVRVETTTNGKTIAEDGANEFWLLDKDGSLELHDKQGLIPGWQAKLASDDMDEQLMCEIVEVKRSESLEIDDDHNPNNVKSVQIKIASNFKRKSQFVGAAKHVVTAIAQNDSFDTAEIWFYKANTKSANEFKDHEFYASYTPDPSKLVFRDKIWETTDPKDSDLFDEVKEFNLCK